MSLISSVRRMATWVAAISLAAVCGTVGSQTAIAQGQDSTFAERDIQVLSEILPGVFSNSNQAYFDVRLKRPENERHRGLFVETKRFQAPQIGTHVFHSAHKIGETTEHYLYALELRENGEMLASRSYRLSGAPVDGISPDDAEYLANCDLSWRRELGHYRGIAVSEDCKDGPELMMVSDDGFWIEDDHNASSPFALIRARNFQCYIDVPGVGGGRDIPYKRYLLPDIHDLGGEKWITTDQGQQIGINLFRVYWAFNNYEGVFARPSFVIYVKTREEEGGAQEVAYSFTSPDAERLGLNLKWSLSYCYLLSNEDVTPFFSEEPKVMQPL